MIIKFLNTFARDEDGATAIEYGLFAALIAAGIVTVVGLLGDDLVTTFTNIQEKLNAALTEDSSA